MNKKNLPVQNEKANRSRPAIGTTVMGIRSEPFRGVVLSGNDIQKFEKQISRSRPSKAAYATVARGIAMLSKSRGTVVSIKTVVRTRAK